ncbi:MAG: regulatory protein RecX [Lachnospiraceae bacterium]|nr:regulatory protein RecX [Lachnospiraceae bacterium]
MIITGIEDVTKSRSRISIDGEFAFVLYKGELRRFHLQVGEELSEKDYETIIKEILPKRAKLRAMNLLLKKDYTTAKLREKLREGGYPEEIVQEALDYVASYHYTDDLRFALDYIQCHQESRSRLRMEQDLRTKGIPEDVVEQAFAEWEAAGGVQDEDQMIRELFRKRGFDPQSATVSEQNREYAFLMRKGFSADCIRKAIFHSYT